MRVAAEQYLARYGRWYDTHLRRHIRASETMGAALRTFDGWEDRTDDHRAARAVATRFVRGHLLGEWRSGEIRTLALSGPPGSGKSHLAASILYELELSQSGTFYTPITDYFRILRAAFDNDAQAKRRASSLEERVLTSRTLVLDDLGTHRGSEWEIEQLWTVIDHRWRTKGVTVITTNADSWAGLVAGAERPSDWRSTHIERMASRLSDHGAVVRVTLPDARRAAP